MSTEFKPKVSIVSPCYNGEKYLPCFFDSLLSQSLTDFELVFVDDGSVDRTAEVFEYYSEKFRRRGINVCYIFQMNQGQAAAVKNGLRLTKGEFIMWFDSDDILLRDALYKKVEYLEKHSDWDFLICRGISVNENALDKPINVLERKRNKSDLLFRDLIDIKNITFVPGAYMVRRNSLLSVIPDFSIYEGRQGQNLQLLLPLAYSKRWGYTDEVLFKYVIRENSHSHVRKTYIEQIKRLNEFEKLITNTISRIPYIIDEEREKWCRYTNIVYCRKKLYVAYKYNNKTEIKKYIHQLNQIDNYRMTDKKTIRKIIGLIDSLLYQIRKKTNMLRISNDLHRLGKMGK